MWGPRHGLQRSDKAVFLFWCVDCLFSPAEGKGWAEGSRLVLAALCVLGGGDDG